MLLKSTYFQNSKTKTYGADIIISNILQSGTSHAWSPIRHNVKVNANHTMVPDKALNLGPTNSVARMYIDRLRPPSDKPMINRKRKNNQKS